MRKNLRRPLFATTAAIGLSIGLASSAMAATPTPRAWGGSVSCTAPARVTASANQTRQAQLYMFAAGAVINDVMPAGLWRLRGPVQSGSWTVSGSAVSGASGLCT